MKKFLLFAATIATLSMNAQDYKVEKVWGTNDVPAFADCRQGVGMNGKFYIVNKASNADEGITPKVLVYDQNGLTEQTFEAGPNCGINIDQAGNLVMSLATFPGSWLSLCDEETALLRVVNPENGESITLPLAKEAAVDGRLDFIGKAKGNLFEDGETYYTTANLSGKVARNVFSEGELVPDDSYLALLDPAAPGVDNMTCVHAVVDAEGNDALFYAYRGGNPMKYVFDGDNLVGTSIACPITESGKVRCNQAGANFFAFDGKDFVIYPIGDTNATYFDGFAVAEVGSEVALFEKVGTKPNPNNFQTNWINAEVIDANTVMIYQYTPGHCMEVYRLSKTSTAVADVNASKTATGVKYVNLAGMQSNSPFEGVNMVVTTYNDGTQNTVKVVK